MNSLYNLARVTTATTGTGTITLGAAIAGFLTFAQAGVPDGAVVTYAIHDDNGGKEVGQGTYTLSGTTLTRTTVYRSTGAGNTGKITLSGSAQVFITPAAEDLAAITLGSTAIKLGDTVTTIAGLTLTAPVIGAASGTSLALSSSGANALSMGGTQPTIGSFSPSIGLTGSSPLMGFSRFSADATAPNFMFGKSRGSVATAGAVVSGDRLMAFLAAGDDASANGAIPIIAATHRVEVDGAVSAGIVPGRFTWETMNSAGVLAERMRLSSLGIHLGGGATSAFPLSRRNGTAWEHRVGDESAYGPVAAAELRQYGGENGQHCDIKSLTEVTTIAAAANTDTTITAPANALVIGVSARVTVAIPTAASFNIGVVGALTRFGTGLSTAAGTTNPGTAVPTVAASATAVRITPNLTPANNNGRVRVTIHYYEITPPTS